MGVTASLFAVMLLSCFFSLGVILTGKILAEEMLIQFFLPYMAICCICIRRGQRDCGRIWEAYSLWN